MNWWSRYFDDNYLNIYSYTEESAETEVEGIVRMLNLTPPSRILDLCCGFGRHSLILASRGYDVTGLDISRSFLNYARRKAEERGIFLKFEQRDMREIQHESEFDAVINIFTAFGFFENEQEDMKVLECVARALKPNGQFVIDTLNRDFVIHSGQYQTWKQRNGTTVLEERFFDFFKSRLEINHHLIDSKNGERKLESSFRLYTLTEMLDMFDKAGLMLTDVYGNFDGSLYSGESPRMILIARRR